MILCHVWIYPLSLLDSVCFISVILILLFTFTLVLQMNLNCFCHVYRRKFMNVTLTLIGCWLISFTCSDGFSLDDILHGYASLSLVRRSCYKNTGRRTDKGMWPNIQHRKAEEIRNTRNRRSVVLLNFDNKTKWVYLKCFCCFFGQVPPNWISRIIVFKRKFGGGGCKWNDQLLVKKKTNNVTECMRILGYNKFQLCAPQIARFYFTYTEPSQYVLSYISKGVSNYIDPIYLSIKQFVIPTH